MCGTSHMSGVFLPLWFFLQDCDVDESWLRRHSDTCVKEPCRMCHRDVIITKWRKFSVENLYIAVAVSSPAYSWGTDLVITPRHTLHDNTSAHSPWGPEQFLSEICYCRVEWSGCQKPPTRMWPRCFQGDSKEKNLVWLLVAPLTPQPTKNGR